MASGNHRRLGVCGNLYAHRESLVCRGRARPDQSSSGCVGDTHRPVAILVMYCRGGESNDICMMGTSVNIRNLRRRSATLALRLSTGALALSLAFPVQS